VVLAIGHALTAHEALSRPYALSNLLEVVHHLFEDGCLRRRGPIGGLPSTARVLTGGGRRHDGHNGGRTEREDGLGRQKEDRDVDPRYVLPLPVSQGLV
jgi:hypothetical protein